MTKTNIDQVSMEISRDDTRDDEVKSSYRSEIVTKSLRLSNDKKISKKKDVNPKFNLVVHPQYRPLTENLSTWTRRRPFRFLKVSRLPVNDYRYRLATDKINNTYTPGTTLCRKCGVSFCMKNTNLCNNCMMNIEEDTLRYIPESFLIKHCQGCDSYSFTGITDFVRAPLGSDLMLRLLLRRVEFHLYKLNLTLIEASFLPADPTSNTIKIALSLEEDTVDNKTNKRVRRHVLHYDVDRLMCLKCEPLASRCTYSVEIRECVPSYGRLSQLLFRVGRDECGVTIKKCKKLRNGFEIELSTENDFMAYFNFISSRFLILGDRPKISANNGRFICVMMCPIYEDDLICVRSSKVFPGLGSIRLRLMICTKVTNSIVLLDPFTLEEAIVSRKDYWGESVAFKVYKSSVELITYTVLEVQMISASLANVKVTPCGDYGKNDLVFTTTTHLGPNLETGDLVYGYDLIDTKNRKNAMIDEVLPDVVLIKKRLDSTMSSRPRKKTSPEYEAFLRDLDKSPEAMFKLSLNGENQAKKSDIDLEGLLADLGLGDYQNDSET